MPTVAELVEEAFREGYALGFEDAAGCASGSPSGKSVDPVGPDEFWRTAEVRKRLPPEPAGAAEPEPLDSYTLITRDIARSA